MGNDIVSLNIDGEIISSALEKKIQAEIVSSLGRPEELIERVVQSALREKVAWDGKKSKYSSDNKFDFIEILSKQVIFQMAKTAVEEFVTDNKELIKNAVAKEMRKPKRINSIAEAFLLAIEESIDMRMMINCSVNFERPKGRD